LVTEGRYEKVRVSPALDIEVYSAEKQAFLSPKRHLSQGTIDQIYVIARFGLHRLLSGGRAVPIILDDPFVNCDEVRKAGMMNLLRTLAQEQQVVLLSHRDEYASGDHQVIRLST
jgi:uncharacterized protein YhaN